MSEGDKMSYADPNSKELPMWIDFIVIALCALCFFIGGKWQHNFRRYIMPVILGIGISLASHIWWLGLTTLPVIGILVMGYGPKSILYKYLSDAGARGMYMFLAAWAIGLGPVLTGHLVLYFYAPYIIIAGILGATLRNLNEIIGDLLFGSFLSSIIIFIK